MRAAGDDPAGLVMGTSVYQLGWTGDVVPRLPGAGQASGGELKFTRRTHMEARAGDGPHAPGGGVGPVRLLSCSSAT